jgi:hypothetical protein
LGAKQSNGRIVLLILFAALIGLAPSIFIYAGVVRFGGTLVLLPTAAGFAPVLAAQRLQPRLLRPA